MRHMAMQGADEDRSMGRKTRATIVRADRVPVDTAKRSAPQADLPLPFADTAALIGLAEELGRLLARRELSKSGGRRAYSLPELLLGATAMVLICILIARLLE